MTTRNLAPLALLCLIPLTGSADPIPDGAFTTKTVTWLRSQGQNCFDVCGRGATPEQESFTDTDWTKPKNTNLCKTFVATNQGNAQQKGWLYGNNFTKGSRYGEYCMVHTDVFPAEPILAKDFWCLCVKR